MSGVRGWRNTGVQLFHRMPKDRGERLRSSVTTDLQELSNDTHWLVVYYSLRSKMYQEVASKCWVPVLKSEQLSDVLHTAINTISDDAAYHVAVLQFQAL